MIFSRLSFLNAAAGLVLLLAGDAAIRGVHAHGGHGGGGEQLPAGESRVTPTITIEGHAGFEDNLNEPGKHYAIDALFGYVFEWGLANEGTFAIEATVGPAAVWNEAEHFWGTVHVEDEHAEEEEHSHGGGAEYKRTDVKGYFAARYQPNDRLSFQLSWMPYFVTGKGEHYGEGLKNEVGVNVTYAFGDGDVDFALGDGLEDVIDGAFISLENRTGWEADSTYIGNYTDLWPGLGFNTDQLNFTISGGPRFYSPGSYSGLSSRTDWGAEIQVEYPMTDKITLFAHWKPIYSSENWSDEGGKGWNHHAGTGVSLSF
ncbi:hypothetical protein [Synechococcus sp. MIT S9508]|uniref:hypothetical protein n=1 Tax=Synechococcus sp. MIT S9508 TaxID=1801629 RepID=UPI0007BC189F|nr:hypothetical protein [Synechococcus sp. MIT S9508]KZR87053.1 hypothetical protein MITS9508_02520 [Synechococcus sp. MIT S9508]